MIRDGVRRLFRLALRRQDRWEHEVEEEITLHLALRAEQLVAQGLAPNAATDEAMRRFGPLSASRATLLDAARHREHHMQRAELVADLRQDISFALRTLGRQKGWAAVTIATLALGIGATTAVFSVVSSLLLHPLPYPHSDRMVFVYQEPSTGNNTGISVTLAPSADVIRAWIAGSHAFEALEGFASGPVSLRTAGEPVQYQGAQVFPSFPRFAGELPIIGRMFTAEDIATHAHVLLLGEQLWRSRYGGQRDVLGTSVTLGDSSYTVIGVLPSALRPPDVGGAPPDFWMPLDVNSPNQRMMLLGRLRAGITTAVTTRELDSLVARAGSVANTEIPFHTRLAKPSDRLRFRDSLAMLSGAVLLVLLVACANVAHLLLARTAARHRELSLRAALGAGRGRLFRQLLTESLLITAAGAALGVALGWAGLRILITMRPPSLDELRVAHLDTTTLAVAAGLTVGSGLLFGIMGALQSSTNSARSTVRSSAATSPGRRSERARGTLVVTEMALSAMLVVGATMLMRSVENLQHADLGFQPHRLYALNLTLPDARYATPAAQAALVSELTQRLKQSDAVRDVSVAAVPPNSMSFSVGRLEVDGEAAPPSSATSFTEVNAVQSNYFSTMGIPMVDGTSFTDTSAAARQVIVNAGFARTHWGIRSAVGHRLRVAQSDSEPWLTIVGVADDAATFGPTMESTAPLLYTPLREADTSAPAIMVRTTGESTALTQVRALMRTIDPHLPMTVVNVEDQMAGSIDAPRFVMRLLSVFTVLALALAGIGLYGVMAYAVAQRTHEIGIRIALGATRQTVARAVMLRGATLAVLGATVGLLAAHWGTRVIEHELFGVATSDPVSFAAAVVVLLSAAALACVVPTRRALSVDPIRAIRAE
ncbi:MAG TPA: ABC transporter permease [Gemmatimonadaceae bacterium]|jgi:predicted permease